MKLSTKPRYAVRLLAQIAVDSENGRPACGKEVAARQGISEAYMEQILIPLRNAGLVTSVRGRNGGYFLNGPPSGITVLDIIELFEGRLELVDGSECAHCQQQTVCPTFDMWSRLSDILRRESAAITLDQVAKKLKKNCERSPDFMI